MAKVMPKEFCSQPAPHFPALSQELLSPDSLEAVDQSQKQMLHTLEAKTIQAKAEAALKLTNLLDALFAAENEAFPDSSTSTSAHTPQKLGHFLKMMQPVRRALFGLVLKEHPLTGEDYQPLVDPLHALHPSANVSEVKQLLRLLSLNDPPTKD